MVSKCRGIDPDKIAVALNNGKKEPGQAALLWRRLGVKILIEYDTIIYSSIHISIQYYIYICYMLYMIYIYIQLYITI